MEAFWTEYVKVLALCASSAKVAADPHWTAYVTAFSTPLVAVLGLWIAYRQWATARDKLRLDLFERRMVIYDAFKSALGQMFVKGQLNPEDENKYIAGVAGSLWLFKEDVHKYLEEEFWNKLMDHHVLVLKLEESLQADERRELAQKKSELRKWFLEQGERSEKMFLPYFGFRHRTFAWRGKK